MTAEIHQLETAPGPGRMATPQLRTLVVCDIADSTALVERMGDQNAANIIRKHDRLARALVERHKGREIDKTDGFLLLFDRPIQAAAFALDYQRGLKHLSAAEGIVVRARVGIHMGDVVIWENAAEDVSRGAKPIEVEGLVKPVAARLAQLARPQQILISAAAAGIAHRAEGELGREAADHVHWKDHGKYRLKGLPDPIEVIEVGEEAVAPLHAPKSGRTARRVLPWWRRPLTLTAEAAMLAIAIGVTAWFLLQSPPTLAFAARDWVVVGNVQNHTNQGQLGTPLDAAFKIGLEQSQYVNVIPDIQVESTLKRMEKPAGTPVNRSIGSDIAMREGARALILPSLAQVGGRIQISAEVIDPHTGVTVYSDSTQADSENQILPATDKLLGKLRGRLGESLASIQKTSMPLAQITTSNMDALQAYTKADDLWGRGDVHGAINLLDSALKLDPDFALAWLRLGTYELYALNDPAAAYQAMQHAVALQRRLSTREKLEVTGIFASFGNYDTWQNSWSTLITLYPDDVSAQENLGLGLMWYRHDLGAAMPHFRIAAQSKHPLRGFAWYSLASAETELGNFQEASKAVAEGRKLHTLAPHMGDTAPALAQRDYAAVLARLDAIPKSLPPTVQASAQSRRAAVAVDQGQDAKARLLLGEAADAARRAAVPSQSAEIQLSRVALDLATKQPDAKQELASLLSVSVGQIEKSGPVVDGGPAIRLAVAAMLAARHGNVALARRSLDAARHVALAGGYFDRESLWRTADCEVRFASSPKEAVACLSALVNGREYFQTHVALLLTYRASSDAAAAQAQAEWLLAHRGQAIAELQYQPLVIVNLLALRDVENVPQHPTSAQQERK